MLRRPVELARLTKQVELNCWRQYCRGNKFPCLLMCPSRCLSPLSSLGIIPTYLPICLPQWRRVGVPMINTYSSAVSGPGGPG